MGCSLSSNAIKDVWSYKKKEKEKNIACIIKVHLNTQL